MRSIPEVLRRWAGRAHRAGLGAVVRLRPAGAAPDPRPPSHPATPPAPHGQDGPTIAAGLTAFGLGSGSRIAVMGLAPDGDRAAVDAIELLGAEAVLVPDHAHGPRLRLRLRGVRAVLTQSPHVPQIAAVVGDLPDLQHLWSWDAGGRDELIAAAHGRMPAFQD